MLADWSDCSCERMDVDAGTEEGAIHLCSSSLADHYLKTYTSHHGPVYAVQWHASSKDIFLSASADSTARLWSREQVCVLFCVIVLAMHNKAGNVLLEAGQSTKSSLTPFVCCRKRHFSPFKQALMKCLMCNGGPAMQQHLPL